MSNAISPITRMFAAPYLTVQEYKDAPTAIDINNLVVGALDPAAQDAELANNIARASAWIDTYCNQVLAATIEVEQQRVRFKPNGFIAIHPNNAPVVALTSLSYGTDPNNMTAVDDCSYAWMENQQILFPSGQMSNTMSSAGPLSFGFPSYPGAEVFVRYTYVNGYANALVVTANAGDTQLVVDDATGFTAGLTLRIYDGMSTENVTVDASYVFGSTTVPLVAALNYDHAQGVSISALPPSVKQAAILVTTAFLKVRGDTGMVMAVTNQPSQAVPGSSNIGQDIAMAQELLKPLRRIR